MPNKRDGGACCFPCVKATPPTSQPPESPRNPELWITRSVASCGNPCVHKSTFATSTSSLINVSHLREVNETLFAVSVPMKKEERQVCSQRILRMVVTRRVPGDLPTGGRPACFRPPGRFLGLRISLKREGERESTSGITASLWNCPLFRSLPCRP